MLDCPGGKNENRETSEESIVGTQERNGDDCIGDIVVRRGVCGKFGNIFLCLFVSTVDNPSCLAKRT